MSKKILTLDNVPVINKKIGKVDTIEKLKASTIYSLGDVVEVLGFHAKGDGAGHYRQKKTVSYNGADAVIGADGSIWGIIHNGEVKKSWFGNTDSFKTLKNVFDYCNSSDVDTLILDKDSNITLGLDEKIVVTKDYNIIGEGVIDYSLSAIDSSYNSGVIEIYPVQNYITQKLTNNFTFHQNEIYISDTTNLKQGDYVKVHANSYGIGYDETSYKTLIGEIFEVTEVFSDRIKVSTNATDDFMVSDNAVLWKINTINNKKYRINFKANGRTSTGYGRIAFRFNFLANCDVSIDIINSGIQGIRAINCVNTKISGCDIKSAYVPNDNLISYGIVYSGCKSLEITNNILSNMKHAIVSSHERETDLEVVGNSKYISITHNNIHGTWHASIAQHRDVRYMTISDNMILNCFMGIDIRQPFAMIFNNYIYGGNTGILARHNCANLIVKNNRIFKCGGSGITVSQSVGEPPYNLQNVEISNNIISDCLEIRISMLSNSILNLIFKNNSILNGEISTGTAYIANFLLADVTNLIINDNIYTQDPDAKYNSRAINMIISGKNERTFFNNNIITGFTGSYVARFEGVGSIYSEFKSNKIKADGLFEFYGSCSKVLVKDNLFECNFKIRSTTNYNNDYFRFEKNIFNGTKTFETLTNSVSDGNYNSLDSLFTTVFSALDTPYHASNMQKLGILDSYHQYLTELHEYEKQQNTQTDTGVMNLNVIQPPVIPTEVEEYAKEYNLI